MAIFLENRNMNTICQLKITHSYAKFRGSLLNLIKNLTFQIKNNNSLIFAVQTFNNNCNNNFPQLSTIYQSKVLSVTTVNLNQPTYQNSTNKLIIMANQFHLKKNNN